MREVINGYRQSVLLEIGITEKELYLVDYFVKFFESGYAFVRYFEGECYFNISPAKIIEDIPFVVKSERNLRKILGELEQKNIIKRLMYCNQSFISINFRYLYYAEKQDGKNVPSVSEITAECCRSGGNMLPTIIKYIKNKIYIYYNLKNKALACDINQQEFFKKLKLELFESMSEASYGVCISKAELRCVSPHVIVLDVKEAMPAIKKYHMQTIENAVNKVLAYYKLIA